MRVAIVSQGNNASGAEIVTAELYREIKNNVVVLSGSEPILNYFASQNFQVKKVAGLGPLNRASFKIRKFYCLAMSLFQLRKQLIVINPDYIHVYNLASLLYVSLSMFCKNKPIILHVHDFYSRDRLLARIARWLKNKPTKIVAVSNSVRLDLINIGFPAAKIRCIHNGIDLKNDWNSKEKHIDGITIGFVGAINEWKGLHVLMKAAFLLDQKGYSLNYVIVGSFFDKEYERKVMSLSEKIKRSKVNFLGPRKDARKLMQQFDILVHCSIENDPFPTVLLEGMHSGCAVIGSQCGGVPEIIDDHETGLLHHPGSPESLSRVLEELVLSSDLRKRIAKNGLEKAQKSLTVGRYRSEFFDYVRPLL